MEEKTACELCGRDVFLTFHHLIPKKMHRRTRFKKTYTKTQLNEGIMICSLCHKGLHKLFDEMTLGRDLNTLPKLRANEKVQKHTQWVRKQKSRSMRN